MYRILATSVCLFVCLYISDSVGGGLLLEGGLVLEVFDGVRMKRTCFFLLLEQGFSNILMDYHGDCCGVFPVKRFRMPL